MHLLTLGLNHTAPLALREQVALPGETLREALTTLQHLTMLHEAAIVSTCNRTEIYCATTAPEAAQAALTHWLATRARLGSNDLLSPYLYALTDAAAVHHAFRVACGIDSMVLGEPQILGQMKDAARTAHESGTLGAHLHQLFQRSFSVAKEVRTDTSIGVHSVSMATAGVRLTQRLFGDLHESAIVFVGAGTMIELTARHFRAQSPRRMVVANRTPERGQALAQSLDAETMPLSALAENLGQFDIVVACTASTLPLIGLGMVERALRARRHRPMVMIDLGVPRDIEPEVARLGDIFLYTVDDLGALAQSGLAQRQAAVAQAEAIISSRVANFWTWFKGRSTVPSLRALHARGHTLKQVEIQRARRMLARGDAPEAVIESMASALTAKFLHGPSALLQRHGADNPALEQLITHLFPDDAAP
jgi:glutamyl-tRNA reductase